MNKGDHCSRGIHTCGDVCGALGLPWWLVLERKGPTFSNLAWEALKLRYLSTKREFIYWKGRKTRLPSSHFGYYQLGRFAISEPFQHKHLREVAELLHALAKSAMLLSQLTAADLDWPQILRLPPPPQVKSRSLPSHLIFHESFRTFQARHNNPSSISRRQLDTTDFVLLSEAHICHGDCSSSPTLFKRCWARTSGIALSQTGQHCCFFLFILFFCLFVSFLLK